MTELDTQTHGLLDHLARTLSRATDTRDLHQRVCEAALDAGFVGARFQPVHGDDVSLGVLSAAVDVEPDDGAAGVPDDESTSAADEAEASAAPVEDSPERESVTVASDGVEYGTLTLVPGTDDATDLDAVADLMAFGLERFEVASRRQTMLEDQARKVRKLHSIAARMAECTSEDGIFQLGMDAAENILEFDISSLDTVEDGMIKPEVLSTGMPTDDALQLREDEGIAGETYQETRTIIVDDLQEHPKGDPENPEFRSLLSVPIEGHGVFQAGAREVGAFDETDAELAELLMTHVSQSLDRLESAAQLRESEQKYRTLVERSHDAVGIYQGGELVFANARADDLLERTPGEILGTGPAEFVHPDDSGVVDEVMETLTDSPDGHATYEARLVTKDGDHRHCECNASRIRYRGGPAVLVSVRDITDRKHRERELERQNEQLEEFASVVSHDLRNPMNVLRGSIDLAAQTGDPSHFERANEALDRMEELVEGVLELARQGKRVDETEVVELATVAENAWRSIDAPTADLQIGLEGTAVDADPLRLQELLENLFRNAVEHGGENVSVTVSPLETHSGFAVTDDGPGIDPDVRDDVFDHGFSSTADGTGFGLAIVDSIADAHGWDARVGDADGARFEVHGISMF